MKTLATLLLAVGLAACSRSGKPERTAPGAGDATAAAAPHPTAIRSVPVAGAVRGIRLERGLLSFCDARGSHLVDPASGVETPDAGPCAADTEPNTACGGLPIAVEVSTPGLGPDDVVDVSGDAFRLDGRVHDCTANGHVLAIVTGSSVATIDTRAKRLDVVAPEGAERVALDRSWLAWSDGSSLRVRRR